MRTARRRPPFGPQLRVMTPRYGLAALVAEGHVALTLRIVAHDEPVHADGDVAAAEDRALIGHHLKSVSG
jgi:hypothetical protein